MRHSGPAKLTRSIAISVAGGLGFCSAPAPARSLFGTVPASFQTLGAADLLLSTAAIAGLGAALIAVVALVRNQRTAGLAIRKREARIGQLEKKLAESDFVNGPFQAVHIVWSRQGNGSPRIYGALAAVKGVPTTPEALLDFRGWLQPAGLEAMEAALEQLQNWGTPFSCFVRSKDGASLEIEGRAQGGNVSVKIRDLAGRMRELAELTIETESLKKEATSLRAVLDAAAAPAWIKDADGNLSWVNKAYIDAVEADTRSAAIKHAPGLLSKVDLDAITKSVTAGETEYRHARAIMRGERRTLEVVETPAAGGSAGLAIDVTETQALRDEIKRLVKGHERTLDQLESAVAIFGADRRLHYHNTACAELWELDSEWLRSKPEIGDIFDRMRVAGLLPSEIDYHGWKKRQLETFTAVEPVKDWWHMPDGRTLGVTVEPHDYGGVTWLFEDLTEKYNLESSYKTLVSVQRETLDHLREGVAMFGSHGRLQLFNPAFADMWELDGTLLQGMPHIDQVAGWCEPQYDEPGVWDEIKADITAVDSSKMARNWRMKRRDGLVLDVFYVPLPQGASLLAFIDETDSSRAETALRERTEALEAADKLKTAFVSHVSYQLREPLTSIIGFNEMLAAETFGELNDKQREYISDIGKASASLDNIINDILDLATIDAGVMELDLSEVDAAAEIQAVAELMKTRLTNSGLTLEIDIAPDAGMIVADEKRFRQVLFNLLTNAIDFSPAGGRIGMGLRREGGDLAVWVSDQGYGIDPGLMDKVFDRFESDSKNGEHRGAGLGLAIVKGFVELHGGKAGLEAADEGGTVVTCRFPLDGPSAVEAAE